MKQIEEKAMEKLAQNKTIQTDYLLTLILDRYSRSSHLWAYINHYGMQSLATVNGVELKDVNLKDFDKAVVSAMQNQLFLKSMSAGIGVTRNSYKLTTKLFNNEKKKLLDAERELNGCASESEYNNLHSADKSVLTNADLEKGVQLQGKFEQTLSR